MYVLNIPTILVDVGGKKRRYYSGDDLKDAPADQLAAMIRLQQAVKCDSIAAESLKQSTPDKPKGETLTAGDWRNLSVASLELDAPTRKVLIEAGLTTAQTILDYGEKHGSLGSVEGIGETREKAIQAALAKAAGK